MPSSSNIDKKIHDADLLAFAEGRGERSITALVELDLPEPQVKLAQRMTPSGLRPVPGAVESRADAESKRTIEEAASLLTKILGVKPNWLEAAHTFIVTATPQQLKQVVNLPMVRQVRPSRKRTK
jgi:hypothetical protein